MSMPYQPWRAAYQQASWAGVPFFVEVDAQSGGRRNALHEFPHRDVPWAEDMGRKARRWSVAAYVIGPDYTSVRDDLIAACEQEGPFSLVHPLLGTAQANCDDYTCSERTELGGYAIFELRFVEAGSQPGTTVTADTQSQVASAGTTSDAAAATSLDTGTGGAGGIGSDIVASQEAAAASVGGAGGIGSGATPPSSSATNSWSGTV